MVMNKELIKAMEKAIRECKYREGISDFICSIDGTSCDVDINDAHECPCLVEFFKGEE